MWALCYAVRRVQKLLRFALYFACRGKCAQGTEGDDYAKCSKIPRATLIEDENVARFRSQKAQKSMVLARCE